MDEWPLDNDGIPHREAARVILRRADGAVYLVHGHDIDDPGHSWWFTVGGGLDGDSPRVGACRELREETGLRVDPERLVGPVLQRESTFHFVHRTRRQDELYFVLDVTEAEVRTIVEGAQLTDLEKRVLDGFRWWTAEEMREAHAEGATFFPTGLPDLVEQLWPTWDGRLRHQTEDERGY